MRLTRPLSTLSIVLFVGQVLARDAVARDMKVKQLTGRHSEEARQLIEPTMESLKAAASDIYEDLKNLEGQAADKAESYLEELFPGIDEEVQKLEDEADLKAIDDDVLNESKPLEHVGETDSAARPAETVLEVDSNLIKGGHHNGTHRNGTHHRRPGHKNKHKHNSTHGHNDTDTPVFEPERYFTEPLITSLLVSFLVFIPLIAMGIAALSSIQVPPYLMAVSKTTGPTQSKKDQ